MGHDSDLDLGKQPSRVKQRKFSGTMILIHREDTSVVSSGQFMSGGRELELAESLGALNVRDVSRQTNAHQCWGDRYVNISVTTVRGKLWQLVVNESRAHSGSIAEFHHVGMSAIGISRHQATLGGCLLSRRYAKVVYDVEYPVRNALLPSVAKPKEGCIHDVSAPAPGSSAVTTKSRRRDSESAVRSNSRGRGDQGGALITLATA